MSLVVGTSTATAENLRGQGLLTQAFRPRENTKSQRAFREFARHTRMPADLYDKLRNRNFGAGVLRIDAARAHFYVVGTRAFDVHVEERHGATVFTLHSGLTKETWVPLDSFGHAGFVFRVEHIKQSEGVAQTTPRVVREDRTRRLLHHRQRGARHLVLGLTPRGNRGKLASFRATSLYKNLVTTRHTGTSSPTVRPRWRLFRSLRGRRR